MLSRHSSIRQNRGVKSSGTIVPVSRAGNLPRAAVSNNSNKISSCLRNHSQALPTHNQGHRTLPGIREFETQLFAHGHEGALWHNFVKLSRDSGYVSQDVDILLPFLP